MHTSVLSAKGLSLKYILAYLQLRNAKADFNSDAAVVDWTISLGVSDGTASVLWSIRGFWRAAETGPS